MLRKPVARSRFQADDVSSAEPRPKYRRLEFIPRFSLCKEEEEVIPSGQLACEVQSRGRVASRPCRTFSSEQVDSARALEDSDRRKWAREWGRCALQVAEKSSWLKEAADLSPENIIRTFLDRAPATLKKHLQGWLRWTAFCLLSGFEVAAPSLAQLFTFLDSLAVGSFLDRGRGRRASAVATLAALQFGAWKLGLPVLGNLLVSAPGKAWKKGTDWHKSLCREAVPLPVAVVQGLEQAASQGSEDSLFLCSMLLMCWCGLRWSDLQRISLDKVSLSDGILRGSCWRTKARRRGMVWGCMSDGFLQSAWGDRLFLHIQDILRRHPSQDFLLEFNGRPMSYSMGLAQFRRCLHIHGGVALEACLTFSLHSLMTTLLTHASQRGVDRNLRAAQGHHQLKENNACVELYGRDDVQPMLECQKQIRSAVRSGWVPAIPLQRGLVLLDTSANPCVGNVEEPCQDDKTDVSSDGELDANETSSSASSVPSSDVESVCSEVRASGDVADEVLPFQGPWVLNCASGVVHRACWTEESDNFCIACRPCAVLHRGYELHHNDPCKQGFILCRHSGCATPVEVVR